jgi:hypothetical protein
MDQPEIKFEGPGGGGAGGGEGQGELESLRRLVAAALVLVIVFTVGVDYYISAQTSELGRMIGQQQQVAQQAVKNYGGFSSRAAQFWSRLVDYSKTHPDFAPVMEKWKGHIVINTNGPSSK